MKNVYTVVYHFRGRENAEGRTTSSFPPIIPDVGELVTFADDEGQVKGRVKMRSYIVQDDSMTVMITLGD